MAEPRAQKPGRPWRNGELVESLCAISPELLEARRRHVANFGTLMPHVFMGDVLSCVGRCLARPDDHAELRSILATLEEGMAFGDRETRGVIGISFTVDAQREIFFGHLRPLLGPRLRASLAPAR